VKALEGGNDMKRTMMAGLVAAQILTAAAPVRAAELGDDQAATPQRGGFAGARLRVPFGGKEKVRAGFALAPMQRSRETGAVRLAAGLEGGLTAGGRFELAAGGHALRLDRQDKAGVSTVGWIAIGVGALLAVTAVAAAITYAEIVDCDDHDDEC
jgi:hypothetical protein